MSLEIQFMKNGKEIKEAIGCRVDQLQSRLERRNQALDEFMKDGRKLRSYLIRMSEMDFSHGHMGTSSALYDSDDISSEEKQEIHQLCRRIFDIEQEIRRLELIRTHLDENQEVNLNYDELVSYGFSDQ